MKYPANYVQSLSPEVLARLPEFCEYDGEARDLKHLNGVLIPTAEAEDAVYVGERQHIAVTHADGSRTYPWKYVEPVRVNADGSSDTAGYGFGVGEALPEPEPSGMTRAELGALGMSDLQLEQGLKKHLNETYIADRPGPSVSRRKAFDRLMAVLMG